MRCQARDIYFIFTLCMYIEKINMLNEKNIKMTEKQPSIAWYVFSNLYNWSKKRLFHFWFTKHVIFWTTGTLYFCTFRKDIVTKNIRAIHLRPAFLFVRSHYNSIEWNVVEFFIKLLLPFGCQSAEQRFCQLLQVYHQYH